MEENSMKQYKSPKIEITHVTLGIFMVSPNSVTPNRDSFDPSGGVMTNSSIWDDAEENGNNE